MFTFRTNTSKLVPLDCLVSNEDAASNIAKSMMPPCDRRGPPTTPPSSRPQEPSPAIIAEALRPHLLSSEGLWARGFPMSLGSTSTAASVYMQPAPWLRSATKFNVNAAEFVPGCKYGEDSGIGSLESSSRAESDDEDAVVRICSRCYNYFDVDSKDFECCVYHWGRATPNQPYSYCKAPLGARGCSSASYHVHSGFNAGSNAPLRGYMRASSPRGGIYALDAEMVYTTTGMELAKLAIIDVDGNIVYQTTVRPTAALIDCNTMFSGVTPDDMSRAVKTLQDVQEGVLKLIGTDTILIGHSLDSDLRALRLIHGVVIDTSALYPHVKGMPYRRSLREICAERLACTIQEGDNGHCPVEDAQVALELVLLKVKKEQGKISRSQISRQFG